MTVGGLAQLARLRNLKTLDIDIISNNLLQSASDAFMLMGAVFGAECVCIEPASDAQKVLLDAAWDRLVASGLPRPACVEIERSFSAPW